MIKLITGVPGAGKTYLSIKLMLDEFFEYSKENQEYVKKKEFKNYNLCTNIDGFWMHDFDLNDLLSTTKLNFREFFTADYQEKITKKHGKMIYVIDECQRYIDPYFKDKDCIFYFDYHRHFEHEIYLISQHRKKICYQISCLAEFEYRAVKRTLSVFGEMKYNIISDYEIFDRKICKPDQKIFALYKSSTHNVKQKVKNPALKPIIICLILFVISGCLLKRQFSTKINPVVKNQIEKKEIKQNQQSKVIYKQHTNYPPGSHSKKKKSINYDNRLMPDHVWVETSALIRNKSITYIVNPISNKLTPKAIYPFKIELKVIPVNGLINIYTQIPKSLLNPEENITTPDSPGRGRLFSSRSKF